MKYFIRSILSLLFLAGVVACDENKQYETEQYKKVFAIVSSGKYNMFEKEHELDEVESTGYISVSMGGTNPTETDLKITLVEDKELFDRYNRGTYDLTSKYAKLLPAQHYTIDSYNMTVPAGQREARLPVKIRPEGLSPDSVYLISLKTQDYSHYEVNPDKADILYRVLIKNYYASQKLPGTTYNMKGKLDEGTVLGPKRMFPLTRNSVRIMAGNPTEASAIPTDPDVVAQWSITLEIADNGHVTIKPFKSGRIQVEQLDGDSEYPNKFYIEDDGFKTYKAFLLHYKYKVEGDNEVHEVKEELRLEFKDDAITY
jgi:hypothetical protein